LWGALLTRSLAEGIFQVAKSEAWKAAQAASQLEKRYPFTLAVHRNWLMTPQAPLDNRTPRDCLHGAIDWIDLITEGQAWNVTNGVITPLESHLTCYRNSPMGRTEVVMYFDLCRELINFGWDWISSDEEQDAESGASTLAELLGQFQQMWMNRQLECSDSPNALILSERQRIPHIVAASSHVIDCDCPICTMMADGSFGPAFSGIDGHHLELDEDFAFSLNDTMEDWERERAEFQDFSERMDSKFTEHERLTDESDLVDPDDGELESNWSFPTSGEIPGDARGHLALSFQLAEIVGELQMGDSQGHIDSLNAAFHDYRTASENEVADAVDKLKSCLEAIACRFDHLTGRAADLQSQLDERLRRNASSS
jgi:hypothetical protein